MEVCIFWREKRYNYDLSCIPHFFNSFSMQSTPNDLIWIQILQKQRGLMRKLKFSACNSMVLLLYSRNNFFPYTKNAIATWLTFYLRNLPTCSDQLSEPLLSKGLSRLSFRFLEFLPLLWDPPEFNLTRMHFDEASGPSIVSVTRNFKFSLKKLCTAWKHRTINNL